jgi:hypothetical protein
MNYNAAPAPQIVELPPTEDEWLQHKEGIREMLEKGMTQKAILSELEKAGLRVKCVPSLLQ